MKSEKCERIDREETREFIRIILHLGKECVRRKDMYDKEDKRRAIKRLMAPRESARARSAIVINEQSASLQAYYPVVLIKLD